MFYGVELSQPAGDGANTTAVQTRAAKLPVACGIHMDDPHAHLFQDRSAHQHVMLTALTSRPAFASWLLLPRGTPVRRAPPPRGAPVRRAPPPRGARPSDLVSHYVRQAAVGDTVMLHTRMRNDHHRHSYVPGSYIALSAAHAPNYTGDAIYMLQLSHMQDVPVAQRHVNISFVTTYA